VLAVTVVDGGKHRSMPTLVGPAPRMRVPETEAAPSDAPPGRHSRSPLRTLASLVVTAEQEIEGLDRGYVAGDDPKLGGRW
jgi:hypothetical protein